MHSRKHQFHRLVSAFRFVFPAKNHLIRNRRIYTYYVHSIAITWLKRAQWTWMEMKRDEIMYACARLRKNTGIRFRLCVFVFFSSSIFFSGSIFNTTLCLWIEQSMCVSDEYDMLLVQAAQLKKNTPLHCLHECRASFYVPERVCVCARRLWTIYF